MESKQAQIDLAEQRNLLADKTEAFESAIEKRDVDAANEIKAELEVIQQKITELEARIEELEEDEAEDQEEETEDEQEETEENSEQKKQEERTKGEDENMEKRQILDEVNEERKAFVDYLETRSVDGSNLKTESGFVVVPENVQAEIYKLQNKHFNLEQYVRTKSVNHEAGSYPVVKLNTLEGLPEEKELEKNPVLAVQPFSKVPYKIKTHRGFFRASQELIEDGYKLFEEINQYIAVLANNTRNVAIIDAIKNGTLDDEGQTQKFKQVAVNDIDGLKKVVNVDVAPHYVNKMALMNQNAYQALDTVKDKNGRYLLTDDIKSPIGKALFGAPVVVVSNDLLKDNTSGRSPIIFGDLEEGITLFKRSEYQAKWEDFMHFGTGIMTAVRQDVRVADKDAVVIANIDFSKANEDNGNDTP